MPLATGFGNRFGRRSTKAVPAPDDRNEIAVD
jgi:hypothetical protein